MQVRAFKRYIPLKLNQLHVSIISVISGITYWLIGYAFAFGEGNDFIGYHNFALHDVPENKYAFWFFQYTFAATAATIVSGAVAERCEFVAYFVYSIGITGKSIHSLSKILHNQRYKNTPTTIPRNR